MQQFRWVETSTLLDPTLLVWRMSKWKMRSNSSSAFIIRVNVTIKSGTRPTINLKPTKQKWFVSVIVDPEANVKEKPAVDSSRKAVEVEKGTDTANASKNRNRNGSKKSKKKPPHSLWWLCYRRSYQWRREIERKPVSSTPKRNRSPGTASVQENIQPFQMIRRPAIPTEPRQPTNSRAKQHREKSVNEMTYSDITRNSLKLKVCIKSW